MNLIKYITLMAGALAGVAPHPALAPDNKAPLVRKLKHVTNSSVTVKKCCWQAILPPRWVCQTKVTLQDMINDVKTQKNGT